MSLNVRLFAAAVGSAALLVGVGVGARVDVAHAGTYPGGGTYHGGGAGGTIMPEPDPTTLATSSFSPQITPEAPCGAVAWGGGCG